MVAFALAGVSLIGLQVTPAAEAQSQPLQATMEIEDNDGLLMPETGRAELPIRIFVTFRPASGCVAALHYVLTIESAPPYAKALVNPAAFTETYGTGAYGSATTEQVRPEVQLIITTTRDARAFSQGLYEVRVDVSAGSASGGCTWGPASAADSTSVTNDFLAHVAAEGMFDRPPAADRTFKAKLTVKNEANGAVLIGARPEAGSAPEASGLRLAEEVRLDPQQTGSTIVEGQMGRALMDGEALRFVVTGTSTLAPPDGGDPPVAEDLVIVEWVASDAGPVATPMPGILLVVGAVAVVAAARRRQRSGGRLREKG